MALFIYYLIVICIALMTEGPKLVQSKEKDNEIGCKCNNHSLDCSTRRERICSNCQHNTKGKHCELCIEGYYGNATVGAPDSCKRCPCEKLRSDGNCFVGLDKVIKCSNCFEGYMGTKCEQCATNYFMDKKTGKCLKCNCHGNGNITLPQICDPNNGSCYQCLNNSYGKFCEMCKAGYFFLHDREGSGCAECFCHGNEDPSVKPMCDRSTGTCLSCMNNSAGLHCGSCASGYIGDAIHAKNCTKEVIPAHHVSSNKKLVLVLSLILVVVISLLAFLICFCWWRRKTLRSRARFVSVEMRGASISSSYDIGLIDPVTGEAVHDLDCEQEVDTLKMTNGNLQIESPYDIDISDTDRML